MKRYVFPFLAAMILTGISAKAGQLLINECVTATDSDWVELVFRGEGGESRDISSLYVTMYYGTNEPIADEGVVLKDADDPLTPWDDRYAVIHLTSPGIPDETDSRGDLNANGIRDLYCNNYSGSLWNSDCIVAIDSDDEAKNGGIIDCLIYSNGDGEPSSSLESYMTYAITTGAWRGSVDDLQGCAVSIGTDGLAPYMSIMRGGGPDTDEMRDFMVTTLPSPGRDNVYLQPGGSGRLLKSTRDTVVHTARGTGEGDISFSVFVTAPCDLSYEIYASTGLELYSSPRRETFPGTTALVWHAARGGRLLPTGLYLCRVTAHGRDGRVEHRIIRLVLHNRTR